MFIRQFLGQGTQIFQTTRRQGCDMQKFRTEDPQKSDSIEKN
jgi:hypothetical protein